VVVKRIIETDCAGVVQQCEDAFREMLEQEEAEVKSAIVGRGYEALWECCQDQPRKS
jgi:hypothetical protein